MANQESKGFVNPEEEINIALNNLFTIQELLDKMKADEFEKLYIVAAAQGNSPTNENISEEKISEVKTVAEFQLEQMDSEETIGKQQQEELKNASNYYVLPRIVNQKINIGDTEQVKQINLYTINDVEGYNLFTIMNNQDITISSSFANRIEEYLQNTYPEEVKAGLINSSEVIEYFTPKNIDEMYKMLGQDATISVRFLPDRIDEFAISKGIKAKGLTYKDYGTREDENKNRDNLSEDNKVTPKETPELEQEPEVTEEKVLEEHETAIKLEEDDKKKEIATEGYIEKIARLNHVNPIVVNTRIIENFEKVEEDTGIALKGLYPRGEVVAVRIPYKLGYRTFLAEKSTGLTIDSKGRMDRQPGKLYDFNEIEDYFRYKIRDGHDGGDAGRPLRYDEGRDYITYIDEQGDLNKKEFVNNKEKEDMLREERERYLAEASEVDKKLAAAIEEYQKANLDDKHEKYLRVKSLVEQKVKIDNKYNALEKQREVTKETKENTENAIGRSLDDEDEWFPGSRFRH